MSLPTSLRPALFHAGARALHLVYAHHLCSVDGCGHVAWLETPACGGWERCKSHLHRRTLILVDFSALSRYTAALLTMISADYVICMILSRCKATRGHHSG